MWLASWLPEVRADEPSAASAVDWVHEATNHLGVWIWETNTYDRQIARLGKSFEVPVNRKLIKATLRMTVDNGYTLFLDGREIGRGSDWRTVTTYEITELLPPGRHFLAVEGFNDRLEGGLILGLHLQFDQGADVELDSDGTWSVQTAMTAGWNGRTMKEPHAVRVVGPIRTAPWNNFPIGLATVPPLHPLNIHFWQRGWFLGLMGAILLTAMIFSLWLWTRLVAKSRAQKFLQVERERIARDIHDDLGSQLTQLLLLGEVAQREYPEASAMRSQFNQICEHARQLAHAMDEVVWAVNARRDTVRDFTSHVCKHAQFFLAASPIRCRFDVDPELPVAAFDLPVRRNLFLAVKEALNNAAKHSQADELFLRIFVQGRMVVVVVEDNGRGFAVESLTGERNGLANLAARMTEVGGSCEIASAPGQGCRVQFKVPLSEERPSWWGGQEV
ncbi:MAG TPA: ATP-binding protein [Verrucomicrobiae bacterium]